MSSFEIYTHTQSSLLITCFYDELWQRKHGNLNSAEATDAYRTQNVKQHQENVLVFCDPHESAECFCDVVWEKHLECAFYFGEMVVEEQKSELRMEEGAFLL